MWCRRARSRARAAASGARCRGSSNWRRWGSARRGASRCRGRTARARGRWRRALPRDVGVGLLRDARPLAAEDGRLARQRDAPMRRAPRRPGVVVVVVPKLRHGPLAQRRLLRPLGFLARREGGGQRVLGRLRPLRRRAGTNGRPQRGAAVRGGAGRPPARGGEGDHALSCLASDVSNAHRCKRHREARTFQDSRSQVLYIGTIPN